MLVPELEQGTPRLVFAFTFFPEHPFLFLSCRVSLAQLSKSASAAGGCQGHAHVVRCTRAERVCCGGTCSVGSWEGASWTRGVGDTITPGPCSRRRSCKGNPLMFGLPLVALGG